jgi:hypothetical protein
VPFEYGMYPLQGIEYNVFEFPDPRDEYVLYLENPQGDGWIVREGSAEQVDRDSPVRYLQAFWELEQIVNKDDSLTLLHDAITRLTDEPPTPASGEDMGGMDTQQTG